MGLRNRHRVLPPHLGGYLVGQVKELMQTHNLYGFNFHEIGWGKKPLDEQG